MARNRVPSAYRQPGYAGVVFVYLLVIGGLGALAYWIIDHEDRIMAGLRFEADVASMTMRVDMPTPPAIRASMVEPVMVEPVMAEPPAVSSSDTGDGTADAGAPQVEPTADADPQDGVVQSAGGAPAGTTVDEPPPSVADTPVADAPSGGLTVADDGAPADAPGGTDGAAPSETETVSLADIIREGLNRASPPADGETSSVSGSSTGEPVRRPEPPRILAETGGLAADSGAGTEQISPTGGPEILLPAPNAGDRTEDEDGASAADGVQADTPQDAGTQAPSEITAAQSSDDAGSTGDQSQSDNQTGLTDPPAGDTAASGTAASDTAADDTAAQSGGGSDGAEAEGPPPATETRQPSTTLAIDQATSSPAVEPQPAEPPTIAAPTTEVETEAEPEVEPEVDRGAPVSLNQLDRLAGLDDAGGAASLMHPRDLNAEPYVDNAGLSTVVLIVQDLGSFHAEAQSAIELLPANVTLAFSPYADDLDGLIRQARSGGHEVLMMLPLEASAAANTDPGSRALRTDLSDEQNRERLTAINDITARHVGLIGMGGDQFLGDASAARLLFTNLSDAGYLFVGSRDVESDRLLTQAGQAGLPTAWVDIDVTAEPSAAAVDAALATLEARAAETGLAVGVADPFPIFFEAIAEWADGLPERGIALAPISSAAQIDTDE